MALLDIRVRLKDKAVEAELVKMNAKTVVVKLKDGNTIKLPKSRLV
jgi:hypothetical protein